MKGGYQILDLTNIDIVLGSEAVTINDNQVLAELLTLREYIEDDYDYSKPLNRKLKPILLRLRDEKEGEEIEASLWANLSNIDDNLSFKIEGIINGKTITVNVVFEKLQDDDGNDYFAIDEANYLLTNQQPIFENITDKDGHNRFIEGDITIKDIEGVTQKYGKWSLSGSHLSIVIAFESVAQALPYTEPLATIDLPQWIKDKIYVIISGSTIVANPSFIWTASDNTTQSSTFQLRKASGTGNIVITMSAITVTATRAVRVAYDLLIDND